MTLDHQPGYHYNGYFLYNKEMQWWIRENKDGTIGHVVGYARTYKKAKLWVDEFGEVPQ